MESVNFEILRDRWEELATLGALAEQYVKGDPASALFNLRRFGEVMVSRIYREHGLPKPFQANQYDLLTNDAFQNVVPDVVTDKLHAIRKEGNKAVHGGEAPVSTALWILREAYDLGLWLHVSRNGGKTEDCPPFREPTGDRDQTVAMRKKLEEQAGQLKTLLTQLEAARSATEEKAGDPEALIRSGHVAATALGFSEEETRLRMIDALLTDAGWHLAVDGGNTEEVTQEHEVDHQPTKTGKGYADYVLWDDDGRPLAVVEAKKAAQSTERGRKQAQLYADGLEKMYGERPVIFYTNGYDISIWDDVRRYPPRKLFGFYSKDSLQYLVARRRDCKPLDTVPVRSDITDRLYQNEAIRAVTERFSLKHRKGLIVQATGTGKTRVAISLTDVLIRARWVRRVLFLCDRKELRKQAKNAFNNFLNEPLTTVSAKSPEDKDKRIFIATYPAMSKIFQNFDTGFFDLIIADESHRSIYNRYRGIFQYFDALQIGLTATPVDFIARNTFRLFGCEEKAPTAYYSLEQAVEEEYLVPYEIYAHTTRFLRKGIRYRDLTDEQRRQLEEDGEDPESFDYDACQIDKQVFNRETNRAVLRNLMEHGLRDDLAQHPGKTVIFARNHAHAVLLKELFDEMFPQFGGMFCQVIDNYDPRAEQLIDDFKGSGSNNDLTLAVSVDMLDTGIDVPEILNLVFAKPVYSRVKFEQMIGRGTRLCPDLLGPGRDKEKFRIFDHWGNFEYFEKSPDEVDPEPSRSLMQQVFEARIGLAGAALNAGDTGVFDMAARLIREDMKSLPEESIPVQERLKDIHQVLEPGVLEHFAPATVNQLRTRIAPLMQWINIRKYSAAWKFDLLIAGLQTRMLDGGQTGDLWDDILNRVNRLRMHLNPVREKADVINRVRATGFRESATVRELETVRRELRGIMQYVEKDGPAPVGPRVIDITDGEERFEKQASNFQSVDMAVYRNRVMETLSRMFDTEPVLGKIRAGEPVSGDDLSALTSMVLAQEPDLDLNLLKYLYPDTAVPLDRILRTIIGMDPEAVKARFAGFVAGNPGLTARQLRFLGMLQNHICQYGAITLEKLYEPPFTSLDSDGVDGIFEEDSQVDELISIIETFSMEEDTKV